LKLICCKNSKLW